MNCRHCKHSADAHVNGECVAIFNSDGAACGCVRCEPYAKRVPTRQWVIDVSFCLKGGSWTPVFQARPFAFGLVGAISQAVREAKKAKVKPRSWILNTRISSAAAIPKRKDTAA